MQEHKVEEFDVVKAADTLEICAESAPSLADPDGRLPPKSALLGSTIFVLRQAKAWLEQHGTPFPDFAGDPLLQAAESPSGVAVGFFVETVRAAVIELVQCSALVALRGGRMPRSPDGNDSSGSRS